MKRKFALNAISSIILQIASIVCGFVLPRLILGTYGSETNGLVNSVTQFLTVISFADMGVSAVIQSALYEPLYSNDTEQVNKVVTSGRNYYKKIASFMWVYIVLLSLIYPVAVKSSFGFTYIMPLVLCMGISQYFQSYVGMTEAMFLGAVQRNYINNIVTGTALIINTVLCTVAIKVGLSIQIVKLITSMVFVVRPIALKIYVRNHYALKKVAYEKDPITQKWNGLAQHIGGIVIEGTDNIILTVFATLIDVSVYSVYYLVTHGVNVLVTSVINNSFLSIVGELWVKNENEDFREKFGFIEWFLHMLVTLLYTCTNVLIVGFVGLYTKGINDTNYIQPVFAFLLVTANLFWCLRMPYHTLIKAANKYKQTQRCYAVAAAINVVVSVICVRKFGLIGVSVGTILAMGYQTIWMYFYVLRNLITNMSTFRFIKIIASDLILYLVPYCLFTAIRMNYSTVGDWILSALIVTITVTLLFGVINMLFFRNYLNRLLKVFLVKKG